IAQFRRDFQLRFNHGVLPFRTDFTTFPAAVCAGLSSGCGLPARVTAGATGKIGRLRSAARNLRREVNCQQHGRHAEQPENLIH
ncbi:hypothetical protein KXV85_001502, partial [Aspergillus fumigatus]